MKTTLATISLVTMITACGTEVEVTETKSMGGRGGELALVAPVSPLMTYRNGDVMRGTIKTRAIFWGKEWTDAKYAQDKITGINRLLTGLGNSAYLNTVTEYSDRTGRASANVVHTGHQIDSSIFPSGDLAAATAVAKVCQLTKNKPDSQTIYHIYGTKKAKANICATHSWGTCTGGAKVLLAWYPDVSGANCTAADYETGNSQGLAALANATAHEMAETITDPRRSGWYDRNNQEISDKCAWRFPAKAVQLSTGKFKLINLWSNAAYQFGIGSSNSLGQRGCTDKALIK